MQQMTDFEAEFVRRTGKHPDQCTKEELLAEAAKVQAEGEGHMQHAAELQHFGEQRRSRDMRKIVLQELSEAGFRASLQQELDEENEPAV